MRESGEDGIILVGGVEELTREEEKRAKTRG